MFPLFAVGSESAKISAILLILLGSLLSADRSRSETTKGDSPKSIRVISYNVQFLPGPARFVNKRKNPTYRAERIGKEMSEYDIVGLNETFDDEPREIILEQLKKEWGDDYNVIVHPKPDDDRFNGGVLIASRLPIIASHAVNYTHASQKEVYGLLADGFAAKGVVHARIARSKSSPDDFIDVFSTHMEARDDSIRELQYPELAEFIKMHSDPAHAAILLGDLNTHGFPANNIPADSQYARLIKFLRDARADCRLIDVWPELMGEAKGGTTNQETTEKGSRIDFIFVSNPAVAAHQLRPTSIKVNPFLDSQVIALSDHSAVEAEFVWPDGKR